MRHRLLILSTALLCACTTEAFEAPAGSPELMEMTFTGSIEPQSRSSLDAAYGIRWSTSDAVTLFAATGSAGSEFKVASTYADGTVATFSGLSPESSNGYYYALAPASSAARLVSSSGTLRAEIPTVQTGTVDSYDPAANISVARVNAAPADAGDILHFKNAGALLSFIVPGNYVNRVKIESRDLN